MPPIRTTASTPPSLATHPKRPYTTAVRATHAQLLELRNVFFGGTPNPSPEFREELGVKLGLTPRWIQSWFLRERKKKRNTLNLTLGGGTHSAPNPAPLPSDASSSAISTYGSAPPSVQSMQMKTSNLWGILELPGPGPSPARALDTSTRSANTLNSHDQPTSASKPDTHSNSTPESQVPTPINESHTTNKPKSLMYESTLPASPAAPFTYTHTETTETQTRTHTLTSVPFAPVWHLARVPASLQIHPQFLQSSAQARTKTLPPSTSTSNSSSLQLPTPNISSSYPYSFPFPPYVPPTASFPGHNRDSRSYTRSLLPLPSLLPSPQIHAPAPLRPFAHFPLAPPHPHDSTFYTSESPTRSDSGSDSVDRAFARGGPNVGCVNAEVDEDLDAEGEEDVSSVEENVCRLKWDDVPALGDRGAGGEDVHGTKECVSEDPADPDTETETVGVSVSVNPSGMSESDADVKTIAVAVDGDGVGMVKEEFTSQSEVGDEGSELSNVAMMGV